MGIMAWEMLAGNVPFTSDNPVTLVFKHVHEDVPSIATACKGIDEGVAAFLAHLTARAVEADLQTLPPHWLSCSDCNPCSRSAIGSIGFPRQTSTYRPIPHKRKMPLLR